MARILGREYARDTIDLGDVSVHNGIEHDASLTRRDAGVDKDQARPALELIEDMLAHATGPGGTITAADMARASSKRRREARASNSAFTLSTFHKLFGSSKYVPSPPLLSSFFRLVVADALHLHAQPLDAASPPRRTRRRHRDSAQRRTLP